MKTLVLIAVSACTLTLSGCAPEQRLPGDPPAAQMRRDRAECEARGGEYAQAGLLGHACFLPTKDAGKTCQSDSDCQGICFAETRQCSKVTPIFGCFSHLPKPGQVEEICVD